MNDDNHDTPTKQCTKCGAVYPATTEYWHRNSHCKYGLNSDCKKCKLEYARKWREENRDSKSEYARKYYEENRDALSERQRKYYEENRDAVLEHQRKWREENRDALSERKRKYYEENYHIFRANVHRRRARIANADGNHTAAQLRNQYKRQRGKCYYCGCELNKHYHADHVIPLSRGGSNDIANIVCACPTCNLSKSNKLPHEWDGTDKLL